MGPAIASFGLCLLAMSALRPIAIAINLIDRPGGRKTHQGDIPVVGGLAMFTAVAAAAVLGAAVGCNRLLVGR